MRKVEDDTGKELWGGVRSLKTLRSLDYIPDMEKVIKVFKNQCDIIRASFRKANYFNFCRAMKLE